VGALSGFTAPLDLELVQDAAGDAVLKDGRCQWRLTRALPYAVGGQGSGEVVTVPAGGLTDLASIPRLVSNLMPPDGPWAKAAVIHDWLYETYGKPGNGRTYTREQADRILREAMEVLGVPALSRWLIYTAVRLGGARGWGS
jgi:hypothetical protein